jgi:protein-disulfide isomerase
MRFAVTAVLCFAALAAQEKPKTASKSALDKPVMEAYVRHFLLVDPRVKVDIEDAKPAAIAGLQEVDVHLTYNGASQDHVFYVAKNGQDVFYGKIFNINHNPFQADLEKIKTDLSPSFGPAGAPLTLVMYADFECPACKEEAKTLRDNITQNYPTQVRVYFKDFPLTQIHPWAKTASIAGRCIYRQNPAKFWDYYDWIYEHQGDMKPDNVKDKTLEFAKDKAIDTMQLSGCIDNNATAPEVDKEMAEGRSLNIDQTPTLFINGRRIPGSVPWPNLKQLIDAELEYQKTADDASEKCCEVKIPSPLNK